MVRTSDRKWELSPREGGDPDQSRALNVLYPLSEGTGQAWLGIGSGFSYCVDHLGCPR